MPDLLKHILHTPHSGIRRMLEYAREVPSPVMLVSGDPNFTTPGHIIDAAAEAAHAGMTGYSPGDGLLELREEVARKLMERNEIEADVDQVCITTGACGGVFTSLMMLLGPGDEILLPDPGWSNYAAMVHVLGATARPYPLRAENGWTADVEEIEAAIGPHTRVLLLNSPGNPAGGVESEAKIQALLEVAARHNLWVVSDEAYDQLYFQQRPTSAAAVGDPSRVVSVFSFSKTYAMTGWRVGYVTGPKEFVRQLSLHQEPVVSCASTVSQCAALAALRGPQDCVQEMVSAYRRRRDLAAYELTAGGIPFALPLGSFFLLVDIRSSGLDSWDFARRLLQDEQIATVPGVAFGDGGEGYVRLTLAAAEESIHRGVQALIRTLHKNDRSIPEAAS